MQKKNTPTSPHLLTSEDGRRALEKAADAFLLKAGCRRDGRRPEEVNPDIIDVGRVIMTPMRG